MVVRKTKKGGHLTVSDAAFRPAKIVRDYTKVKLGYKHLPQDVHVKKNYRDQDGAVMIGPRNFTTMNAK